MIFQRSCLRYLHVVELYIGKCIQLWNFELLYAVNGENWLCGEKVTSRKPAALQVGCVIKRLWKEMKKLSAHMHVQM